MQMASTTETLGSQKQLALLNDIDKLRSHGISQYVNLPQLIVCGDQSSGKSSVLEAISGLQFPIKDNLCTRFATEVILRNAPEACVAVKIVAGPERSKDEQTKLNDFRRDLIDLEDFSALIEEAKSYMGVADGSCAFSTDVLRLEVSGPKQPHLTIVDLPGLIHSENNSQTTIDVQIVQSMVHEYMTNQRSIILAVISAKNDYANQIILSMAQKADPPGTRTMGVITKPDTLSAGSESELAYLNLARNLDVGFRLGWHVLKNRSYETRTSSSAERDEVERKFLSQGVWKDLPRQSVGIHALRDKLSQVLLNHIRAELPRLIDDIKKKLHDCESALDRLGPYRDSLEQQRLFLLQISQEFQAVSKIALDGSYGHGFFGDPRSPDGYTKRLRAVVQNLNKDFAETVRLYGQKRRIVDQIKTSDSYNDKKSVTRAAFIDEIKELLSITRGRELLGMFNPLIVSDLFFEQSQPWEKLAQQHLRKTWQATKSFLELLVSHLADEKTSEALLGHVIDTIMERKLSVMSEKLSELLKPYQKGHPITYNHYFTETVQRVKEKRREAEIGRRLQKFLGRKESAAVEGVKVTNTKMPDLLSALASSTEADMDRYACSEILDCMEAFYKVLHSSLELQSSPDWSLGCHENIC